MGLSDEQVAMQLAQLPSIPLAFCKPSTRLRNPLQCVFSQ